MPKLFLFSCLWPVLSVSCTARPGPCAHLTTHLLIPVMVADVMYLELEKPDPRQWKPKPHPPLLLKWVAEKPVP